MFIYSYFLFIWLYGILSSQSPDIITSHIPLSDITSCSVSSLPSILPSFIPHSWELWPAEQAAPPRVYMDSSSSMLIEMDENSQSTWIPLKCPETSDDHIKGFAGFGKWVFSSELFHSSFFLLSSKHFDVSTETDPNLPEDKRLKGRVGKK